MQGPSPPPKILGAPSFFPPKSPPMIVLIGVVVLMSIYLSAVPKYTVYYIIYIQIIIETIMSYSRVAAIRSPVKRVGLHYRPPFFINFCSTWIRTYKVRPTRTAEGPSTPRSNWHLG